ncbi:MAG: DUF1800 domain-containing protein [Roseiflexaceae bacterium]
MAVSRRRFLSTTTTIGAAAAASSMLEAPPEQANAALTETATRWAQTQISPAAVVTTGTLPSYAIIALNRMGYGPRPGDAAAFAALGATPDARLTTYVDQQLNPDAINDSECDAKLAAARLKIKYDAYIDPANPANNYPAKNEAAPLSTLNHQMADLWPRARGIQPYRANSERYRPFEEVRVAAWVRAVHSKRQLKEVLVDFWHNHFNVNINSDGLIPATFPLYDRIMRTHCLGNFRTMLEEVAKSAAMLTYLDNASSMAGGGEGANENYARELFELHTLGADNYLKFYNNQNGVGAVTYNGKEYPRGYVDEDVYEAANCLTGWTTANGYGRLPGPDPKPNTGEFLYADNWHDKGPKFLLSIKGLRTIEGNQPPLKDAQDLFTMLADHPGTARSVCTKLCRRLIADDPPGAAIEAAVATWMANISAPDQLKKVVRTILLSSEFKNTWGQKMKRPFDFLAAYFRATNATLPVDEIVADPNGGGYWNSFFWNIGATGHKLFEWATPTGYPDRATYWASTNGMLRRWNLPYVLTQIWGGRVELDLRGQTDVAVPGGSSIQIVDFWIDHLCGYTINPSVRLELIDFLAQKAQGGDPNQPPRPMNGEPNNAQLITDRINAMVQLLAMSPDFQAR